MKTYLGHPTVEPDPKRFEITITYSRQWKEYKVPGLSMDGSEVVYSDEKCYFTPDKEDAEGTAVSIFGQEVIINYKTKE